jgi:hypothetical protein
VGKLKLKEGRSSVLEGVPKVYLPALVKQVAYKRK